MLKFLLSGLVISVALACEINGILHIAKTNFQAGNLPGFLIWHIGSTVLTALVLPISLSHKYQDSWAINLLFIFSMAFFIPLLGIVGLIFAVIPGLLKAEQVQDLPMHINKIRALPEVAIGQDLSIGNGLDNPESNMHSHDPELRMNAVYATLKLDDKVAIPLLRMALRDPVDDIRLLAYALIDRKEHRISQRIEEAREKLASGNNQLGTRHLYRSIVNDYWELAHLGLVEGETLNYILNKAQDYLETGLQRYPKDRGLHLQYAKLLLRSGKSEEAYKEFKLAENLGISKQKLLLYYAEIAYLQRRFSDVKRYMSELKLINPQPQIQQSQRFWQPEIPVVG